MKTLMIVAFLNSCSSFIAPPAFSAFLKPTSLSASKTAGPSDSKSPLSISVQASVESLLLSLEEVVKNGASIGVRKQTLQDFDLAVMNVVSDINSFSSTSTSTPPSTPPSTHPSTIPYNQFTTSTPTQTQTPTPTQPSSPQQLPEPIDPEDDSEPLLGGMAPGTRNTYVIPGMESMSPKEYRVALQDHLIKEQENRLISRGGKSGNRVSNDYMESLGAGTTVNTMRNDSERAAVEREVERRKGISGSQRDNRENWGVE